MAEMFGTRFGYGGAAIGHQIGAAVDGFTSLIAAASSAVGGWTYVAAYTMPALLVSAACIFLTTQTFREDIAAVDRLEGKVIMEPRIR